MSPAETEGAARWRQDAIAKHLRVGVSGGSALPVEVFKRFEERFCVPILEGYGLSEISPIATFTRIDRSRKPGSIGLPAWGVEVSVVRSDGTEADIDEPGEIRIRGHNVMKGYLHRPDATAEAIDPLGWFRKVLLTHPAVSLAAVVGVPHASHGEEVKAFVVRKPGATATEADIVAWCRRNTAGHKYPRIVEFRDGLPMTATGRILKRDLADQPSV